MNGTPRENCVGDRWNPCRAGRVVRHFSMKNVMSRGPQSFKKRDVTRAVEAVMAAGVSVARVEVDKDGKIVVVAGKPLSTDPFDKDEEIVL